MKNILVAEHDGDLRNLLATILEGSNRNIDTAIDGPDALRQLRQNIYNLVISDNDMPGNEGMGILIEVRIPEIIAQQKPLPCILLATEFSNYLLHACKKNDLHYVRKEPGFEDKFLRLVVRLLKAT